MSAVLTFVEYQDGTFVPSSLGVLSKAKELAGSLGGEMVAVTAGHGAADAAGSLGAYGADRVLVADGERFSGSVAAPFINLLQAAVEREEPRLIVSSASVLSAEVAGGLAGRLQIGINTDGIDIRADGESIIFRRPALGDSVHVDCGWTQNGTGPEGIALFRANSFAPASNGGQAMVEQIDVPDTGEGAVEFLGREQEDTGGVDITEADMLVGAGRGLGSPDNFGIVESLAKTLGAEVATTRAVVDAGWYDYSTQVGQTGKTVSPKLYVAVGISGAIQHKIGMQSAGTIIAINKDPNAPIFEYADLGVVGDLFEIVPKLEEEIRSRKGS